MGSKGAAPENQGQGGKLRGHNNGKKTFLQLHGNVQLHFCAIVCMKRFTACALSISHIGNR